MDFYFKNKTKPKKKPTKKTPRKLIVKDKARIALKLTWKKVKSQRRAMRNKKGPQLLHL